MRASQAEGTGRGVSRVRGRRVGASERDVLDHLCPCHDSSNINSPKMFPLILKVKNLPDGMMKKD